MSLSSGPAVGEVTVSHSFKVEYVPLVIPPDAMGSIQVGDVEVSLGVENGEQEVVICLKELLELAWDQGCLST